MSKKNLEYFCRECGAKYSKWMGRCSQCQSWSSIEESQPDKSEEKRKGLGTTGKAVLLKDVDSEGAPRQKTGISELDNVLGGGLVKGSLILIGGDPGIGKSTLLLQTMVTLSTADIPCLYVTGEESLSQVKMRANRLQFKAPSLNAMCETNLDIILAEAVQLKPDILVIDSIQTIYKPELTGSPGAESQLREVTLALMVFAKTQGCTVILVGHVTKGGQIAGPKVIEHMVDTVVYFEGDKHHSYRVLRSVKNRFGATHEIGVFEMTSGGLTEIKNPSSLFIQDSEERDPGSVITCSMEGTRPLLLEIQALVNRTSFSNAQRVAMGIDQKRLTILLALLEKFAGVEIGMQDVFVNVAGGIRMEEPAADLALAAAVASNHLNKASLPATVALGELGLNGEIRSVSHLEARIKECIYLGFKRIITPPLKKKLNFKNIELIQVKKLSQGLEAIYG